MVGEIDRRGHRASAELIDQTRRDRVLGNSLADLDRQETAAPPVRDRRHGWTRHRPRVAAGHARPVGAPRARRWKSHGGRPPAPIGLRRNSFGRPTARRCRWNQTIDKRGYWPALPLRRLPAGGRREARRLTQPSWSEPPGSSGEAFLSRRRLSAIAAAIRGADLPESLTRA
jgi:hypothetical protein